MGVCSPNSHPAHCTILPEGPKRQRHSR